MEHALGLYDVEEPCIRAYGISYYQAGILLLPGSKWKQSFHNTVFIHFYSKLISVGINIVRQHKLVEY